MDAEEQASLPMLSNMDIIIMQIDSAAHPQIIVHRRPMRSKASAGAVLPIGNIN